MTAINSISSDLNQQWRKMHAGPSKGRLPDEVLWCYFRTIRTLLSPGTSRFFRINRCHLVEQGGLFALRRAMYSPHAGVREAAEAVLCEVSKEPTLLRPILLAGLPLDLAYKLERACTFGERPLGLRALRALGELSLNAARYFARIREGGPPERLAFTDLNLEADASQPKPDAPADEFVASAGVELPRLVPDRLAVEAVVQAAARAAEGQVDKEMFVEAVRVLGRLAATYGRERVLRRLTDGACGGLARLAAGMQAPEPPASHAMVHLVRQLCAERASRDRLIGSGAGVLVLGLCGGEAAFDTWPGVAGLRCLAALSQVEEPTYQDVSALDLHAPLAAARDALYDELLRLATYDGERGMTRAASRMHRVGGTRAMVGYLVRMGDAAMAFPNRAKAAIVLCGMLAERSVVREVVEAMLRRVLEFLMLIIRLEAVEVEEKRNDGCHELRCRGLRAACTALTRLLRAGQEHAQQLLWDMQHRFYLLGSLRTLLELYNGYEAHHSHRKAGDVGCGLCILPAAVVEAALLLLQHLAPTPTYETLPDATVEPRVDYVEAEVGCMPHLEKLCEVFTPSLLRLAAPWPREFRVAGRACGALARLATTYDTCMRLAHDGALDMLQQACADIIPRVVGGGEVQEAQEEVQGRGSKRRNAMPPATYFELLANLARIVGLRPSIQDRQFLRLGLDVLRQPALPEADEGCGGRDAYTTHVLMLASRMAHTYTPEVGQADNLLLSEGSLLPQTIVAALTDAAASRHLRYAAATAAASLLRDTLKSVPQLVSAGLIPALTTLLDEGTPQPTLRRVLEGLKLIAIHPSDRYRDVLGRSDLRPALFRVSNCRALGVGYKSRIAIADIASELLLILDRSAKGRSNSVVLSAPAPVAQSPVLPSSRLAVPRGGFADHGLGTCGQPGGPGTPRCKPPPRRPRARPQTGEGGRQGAAGGVEDEREGRKLARGGCDAEARPLWRRRWEALSNPQRASSARVPRESPPDLSEDELRRSRPMTAVEPREVGVGGADKGKKLSGSGAGVEPKGVGQGGVNVMFRGLMLDHVFEADEAAEALLPRPRALKARMQNPTQFNTETSATGHLVEVKGWREAGPRMRGAAAVAGGERGKTAGHTSLASLHEYVSRREAFKHLNVLLNGGGHATGA
jgi:hypothetical protein